MLRFYSGHAPGIALVRTSLGHGGEQAPEAEFQNAALHRLPGHQQWRSGFRVELRAAEQRHRLALMRWGGLAMVALALSVLVGCGAGGGGESGGTQIAIPEESEAMAEVIDFCSSPRADEVQATYERARKAFSARNRVKGVREFEALMEAARVGSVGSRLRFCTALFGKRFLKRNQTSRGPIPWARRLSGSPSKPRTHQRGRGEGRIGIADSGPRHC